VKGKLQPVAIYELLDTIENQKGYEQLLAEFKRAMAAYRDQDWQEAAGRFGVLSSSFPNDGPTQVFLQRSLDFMEHAPEPDWDGVYVMKTK
jgi:adenylate cyclase